MSKKVTEHTLDLRVREVLKLVNAVSKTGVPENAPEESRDTPETAELLRKIGSESIVLLKNEGDVLPFKKDKTVSKNSIDEGENKVDQYTLGRRHRTPRKSGSLLRWRFRYPQPILRHHPLPRNHL